MQHTAKGIKCTEKIDDFLGHPVFHHDGIGGVHFNDLTIEATDGSRDLRILQHLLRGEFIQSRLTYKELIIGEVSSLHHIDLLLYLSDNLHNLVFIAPGGDGVFMNARNTGGRHVQTLDIHLTTGEYGGYLIQDTRDILGINQQGI